jgi:hypothetical protein
MGNCCGKQSDANFEGPGRTLGDAPAPATKASIPGNAATAGKRTVGGPARTLGEGNAVSDPKAAAAAAAEVRNTNSLEREKDSTYDDDNLRLKKQKMTCLRNASKNHMYQGCSHVY